MASQIIQGPVGLRGPLSVFNRSSVAAAGFQSRVSSGVVGVRGRSTNAGSNEAGTVCPTDTLLDLDGVSV